MCSYLGIVGERPTELRKNRTAVKAILFLRGDSWTRTNDPIDVNDVLYRLSHATGNRRYYTRWGGIGQGEIFSYEGW